MKIKNPHPSPYKLEQAIEDCHDWFHPDDLETMALRAFQMARRDVDLPENFPVCKRGVGRYWMAEELVRCFELLIHDLAYRNQVPGFHSWATDILKLYSIENADQTIGAELVDNLSTNPPGQSNQLSPTRHNIHRRASQNGKSATARG